MSWVTLCLCFIIFSCFGKSFGVTFCGCVFKSVVFLFLCIMVGYRQCLQPVLVCLYFPIIEMAFMSSFEFTESLSNSMNLETQTMCPFLFNLIQEYENGGYCSTENAIRERRAYGPELSHEDFTKFHEVWYQCNRQPTHHLSSSIQSSQIHNHISPWSCDIILQKFKFSFIGFPCALHSSLVCPINKNIVEFFICIKILFVVWEFVWEHMHVLFIVYGVGEKNQCIAIFISLYAHNI